MKYTVVGHGSLKTLIEEVNKFIVRGWEPIGGISATISESDEYHYSEYAQAMTKEV